MGDTGPVTSTNTLVLSFVFLLVGPETPPEVKSITKAIGPSVAFSGTVYSAT